MWVGESWGRLIKWVSLIIIVANAGMILSLMTIGVGLILPLLLHSTPVMFVLTICGHWHVAFPANTMDITTKRPT